MPAAAPGSGPGSMHTQCHTPRAQCSTSDSPGAQLLHHATPSHLLFLQDSILHQLHALLYMQDGFVLTLFQRRPGKSGRGEREGGGVEGDEWGRYLSINHAAEDIYICDLGWYLHNHSEYPYILDRTLSSLQIVKCLTTKANLQ